MTTAPTPKISRAPKFPFIWVVPLIAVGIGIWMAIREFNNRGPEITIDFADGSGVEADKTVLVYKGVTAGTVERVWLKSGLEGVGMQVRLRKSAEGLAREGSKFWIVHPEIGFEGVHGLDTLVSGVKLNVRPGKGPPAKHFIGLEKTPPPDVTKEGRSFMLRAEKLGSMSNGAPVFYREFKVGEVEASHLAPDGTAVLVRIHLEEPYADLVRTSTKFWNAGGFSFNVSLFGGAQLKNTSLESLVTGGVAFATPDTGELAPPAPNEAEFGVAAEPEKEWLKWAPKIPVHSPETGTEPKAKTGILNELIK
jgi:paraquat-inducible protein B